MQTQPTEQQLREHDLATRAIEAVGLDARSYQLMDRIGGIVVDLIQNMTFDTWCVMRALVESEAYVVGLAEMDGITIEEARQGASVNVQIADHIAGIARIIESEMARDAESSSPQDSSPEDSQEAAADV